LGLRRAFLIKPPLAPPCQGGELNGYVFGDPLEISINDPEHSVGEYRFLSIGNSGQGQLLVVSYTEEEQNYIRIISARLATKKEQKNHENIRRDAS